MITLTITMNVLPDKRQELLDTIEELAHLKQQENGYLDSCVCMNAGNMQRMMLTENWETQDAVDVYMLSEYFQIWLGAMKLLTASAKIEIMNQQEDDGDDNKTGRKSSPIVSRRVTRRWKPYENINCRRLSALAQPANF
jgi:quinol monooxygenase YgiN